MTQDPMEYTFFAPPSVVLIWGGIEGWSGGVRVECRKEKCSQYDEIGLCLSSEPLKTDSMAGYGISGYATG